MARTLRLDLALGYPEGDEPTSKSAVLILSGLSHFLAYLWLPWPEPVPIHTESDSPEKYQAIVDEWIKKGSVQTICFQQLSELLTKDALGILDARGSFQPDRSVLEIEAVFDSGPCAKVQVAGSCLAVQVDERTSSIEELLMFADA